MAILLLDVGNSRLKWIFDEDLLAGRRAEVLAGDAPAPAWETRPPQEVWVSCVRDGASEAALRDRLQALWPVPVRLARSCAYAAGVHNAYEQPTTLGVDRWLALLAAARRPGAALVVDAGTALTIDALDAEGQHLGGYILPGTALMLDALQRHTARVRIRPEPALRSSGFARNTHDAVLAGLQLAQQAAVQQAYAQLQQRSHKPPRLVLTGGGGAALQEPWSAAQLELEPDLVLWGLLRWGQDCGAGAAVPL